MGIPHPLRHIGEPSFMKQRYSVGRKVHDSLLPAGDPVITPCVLCAQGFFFDSGSYHAFAQ